MHIYLGLFTVAFSALSLEVLLVRLLSVTTWYHLSFFAISTAMLGTTAGATRVYLGRRLFARSNLEKVVGIRCIYLSLSIPASLVMLCLIPLSIFPTIMSLFSLAATTVVCALPFYFVGMILSAVLTKVDLPMGKLYAADLIGASLGCLFVLAGLEVLDVPSLILLCGCTSALGGCFFSIGAPGRYRLVLFSLFGLLCMGGLFNATNPAGIRPLIVKGTSIEPSFCYAIERWNSFSRVAVYERVRAAPQYWGPSPLAPRDPVDQYVMNIDGEAGTVMRKFHDKKDIDHLRFDVANVGYHLGRKGEACIIGVGGGRDIQSALLFGHPHVTGVEVNPIFIDLLQHTFRDFAGIAGRSDVTLVKAEARSYLSHDKNKYSIIQMSLIDTWAATGAGAFSLSENSLYTVEAWNAILARLDNNGIFSVSRWHSPTQIGETARLIALATATLLQQGVADPSEHLALVTSGRISTLLVSRQPLAAADIDRLQTVCKHYRFRPLLLPGQPAANPLLAAIVSSRTSDQLLAATSGGDLNCAPTTDESPYFFNMLRLSKLGAAFDRTGGVISGNLVATFTLAALLLTLLVLVGATILAPLLLRQREPADPATPPRVLLWGAIYFSLIGAAFMLTEIALIQRLTVLLSHPIYALGILLFTIIASSGLGSLLSDRLPLTRSPWIHVYPLVTAALIVGVRLVLSVLLDSLVAASITVKIAAAIAVISPLGLLMGMFFPTGMRLAKSICPMDTPWYWALNGIFGVLCSALAVFISIYISISTNFYLAAACYLAVLIPLGQMRKQATYEERRRAQEALLASTHDLDPHLDRLVPAVGFSLDDPEYCEGCQDGVDGEALELESELLV